MMQAGSVKHIYAITVRSKPNSILTIGKDLVDVVCGKPVSCTVIPSCKFFINPYFCSATQSSQPNRFILPRDIQYTAIAKFFAEAFNFTVIRVDPDGTFTIKSRPDKTFRVRKQTNDPSIHKCGTGQRPSRNNIPCYFMGSPK